MLNIGYFPSIIPSSYFNGFDFQLAKSITNCEKIIFLKKKNSKNFQLLMVKYIRKNEENETRQSKWKRSSTLCTIVFTHCACARVYFVYLLCVTPYVSFAWIRATENKSFKMNAIENGIRVMWINCQIWSECWMK